MTQYLQNGLKEFKNILHTYSLWYKDVLRQFWFQSEKNKIKYFLAPILGWGRYETFEFGCTVAFHDPSLYVRSYVLFTFCTILTIPLVICCYSYGRIIWFTYQCKLELFVSHDSPPENDNDLGGVNLPNRLLNMY